MGCGHCVECWRDGELVGGFALLDARFSNDHLTQFGLATVSRDEYHLMLEPALGVDAEFDTFDDDGDSEKVLRLARQG